MQNNWRFIPTRDNDALRATQYRLFMAIHRADDVHDRCNGLVDCDEGESWIVHPHHGIRVDGILERFAVA